MKRVWLTVPQILAGADVVEVYPRERYKTYAHFPDRGSIRIHTATVSNLLKALQPPDWKRSEDDGRIRYERIVR